MTNLCKNGGTCENKDNSHVCNCAKGFQGSYCESEINECLSAPCQNGATCTDLVGRYSCQCAKGFQVIFFLFRGKDMFVTDIN